MKRVKQFAHIGMANFFSDPFRWTQKGTGLKIKIHHSEQVAHEALFEDEITAIKDRPMYLGVPFPLRKFYIWTGLLGALIMGLVLRSAWMQIVQGQAFSIRAENNRLRHEIVSAKRGIIYDRDGIVLADNASSFNILTVPWLLPRDADERESKLIKVARMAGIDASSVIAFVASSTDPTEEIVLKRDISYDRAIALQIMLGDDPAIRIEVGSKRSFPLSSSLPSLSHVLGYVGNISPDELKVHKKDGYHQTDLFGKTGIEATYESSLRGNSGMKVYEVDAHNRVTNLVADEAPEDGKNLTISISSELQRAAETALRERLAVAHASSGSVLVMDPRDGSLLAAVSLPAYDNNIFSGGVSSTVYAALLADAAHPLLPRAWAGVFPAGSTMKPAYATAALAEGIITPQTTVYSVGGIRIGNLFFPDWKAGGHGPVNVRKAIAWSVNTFFYYIGGGYDGFVGLGVDRLGSWLQKFGIGSKTGLDIPGEQSGFVPNKIWKEQVKGERWYIGDTYNLSIGQGDLLVTPLQIARVTAILANGGHTVQPHVLRSVAGEQVPFTVSTGTIADPAHVQVVREGMRDTVIYGSGRSLASFPVPVAGKTGTAQWRKDRNNHAWFTSFAPFEAPEVVVTVLIEEGVEGSVNAAPVAKKVLEAWYARRQRGL